ncbi:MAG: hypothetical protein M9959_01985 [Chitinophagaceae bacterium]|nr:hypothetical protein [Chitinophagaceae bacterium]
MEKVYMIVELFTDEVVLNGDVYPEPVYYTKYDIAFECLNERVEEETGRTLKQQRGEKPLRVQLDSSRVLELWIATREALDQTPGR